MKQQMELPYDPDNDSYQNNQQNNLPNEINTDTVSPIIIIIPLIAVILAFLCGLLFMRAKQQKSVPAEITMQTQTVRIQEETDAVTETTVNTLDQTTTTEVKTTVIQETATSEETIAGTEAVSVQPVEPEAPAFPEREIIQESAPEPQFSPVPAFELKDEYRSIVNRVGAEINTGYYADVNGDGQNELILKNPNDMNYHMYTYDGEMHETYFGSFTSMNEAKLFRVPAANGQYYFYWRCEYQMYSIQGYYDPLNNSEIDIGVNYNFADHAEWILFFNNNEYASGREEGASTYGATPNCYQKLLTMFQDYSFQIYDNSDYKKLDCLDKAKLLDAIG